MASVVLRFGVCYSMSMCKQPLMCIGSSTPKRARGNLASGEHLLWVPGQGCSINVFLPKLAF